MSEFFQDAPALGNQFLGDATLRATLARLLPRAMHDEVAPDLERLGARVVGDILELARDAEAHPPRHVPFDAWGRRVDVIETSAGWRALERVAAEEGFVARGYERRWGAHSRIDQFARLYLYHPSSALHSCPLAMTDGAARCLELHGGSDAELRRAHSHLTTRDPNAFWTAGQWMTERAGGSDVSDTSTIARREGDEWRLTGTKWFTSATTSPVALTLARPEGAPGGNAGLSLFFVRLREDDGALRGIRVLRLKDKLGTRALPTAELSLEDTPATLVGGAGHGVRKIASVLTLTRVYNAVCAAAMMRRAIALATDYALRRRAFGRTLAEHPLHVETLAALVVEHAAALQLVFHVAGLLGREECGDATADERAIARLLVPVTKLYTGKQAVAVTSEVLEAFGGAGYIEDTGLPVLLRDAQVLPIWEGTTNVLSLDARRAIEREGALAPWLADVERRASAVRSPSLAASAARVREAARAVGASASEPADAEARATGARALAFSIARATMGALLLEHAEWTGRAEDAAAACRWCAGELAPLVAGDERRRSESATLVLGAPAAPAPPARERPRERARTRR